MLLNGSDRIDHSRNEEFTRGPPLGLDQRLDSLIRCRPVLPVGSDQRQRLAVDAHQQVENLCQGSVPIMQAWIVPAAYMNAYPLGRNTFESEIECLDALLNVPTERF